MHKHAFLGREIVPLALQALPPGIVALPPIRRTPEWVRVSDPVAWSERFTTFAAKRYGLTLSYFKVKFEELDGAAVGEVRDYGSEFLIRVEPLFKDDAAALSHILAHEVAHVVLNRAGIGLEPERSNELLTDTVAVLAGFGELFLGKKLPVKVHGFGTMPIATIGYLNQAEIRWLNRARYRLGEGAPWPRRRIDRLYMPHEVGPTRCRRRHRPHVPQLHAQAASIREGGLTADRVAERRARAAVTAVWQRSSMVRGLPGAVLW